MLEAGPQRNAFVAQIDQFAAAVQAGDMQAVRPAMKTVMDTWKAFGIQRVHTAAATAVRPACLDWRNRLLQEVAATGEDVRLQGGRLEIPEWERQLDQVRQALLRYDPDAAIRNGRVGWHKKI